MNAIDKSLYFEDFSVGQKFITKARTITEADIVNFVGATGMGEVLFINLDYLENETNFDDRLVFDAQKIFFAREPRDLTAALKFYCGEEHDGAHSAADDTEATLKVIFGQMEKYQDLPDTMEDIDAICNPREPNWVDRRGRLKAHNGDVVINFGKYQNQSVAKLAQTDLKFLQWIIRNDFPRDTQEIIQAIIDGDPPQNWLP